MSQPDSPRGNTPSQLNSPRGNTPSQPDSPRGNTPANVNLVTIQTGINGNTGTMEVIEGNVTANYITDPVFANVLYSNTFINGNVERKIQFHGL